MVTNRVSDPRAAVSTVLDGPADLVGDQLLLVEQVEIDDQKVLVPTALPGAADYIACLEAERRAEELRPRLVENLDTRGDIPTQMDATLVFDVRANAGTALMAAATGFEAFANHHIRRSTPVAGIDLGSGRLQDADELCERRLNERYSVVLPALLGTSSPAQRPWWKDFRRIQTLAAWARHSKNEQTRGAGLVGEANYSTRIYNGEYVGTARTVLSAFDHFSKDWLPEPVRVGLRPDV